MAEGSGNETPETPLKPHANGGRRLVYVFGVIFACVVVGLVILVILLLSSNRTLRELVNVKERDRKNGEQTAPSTNASRDESKATQVGKDQWIVFVKPGDGTNYLDLWIFVAEIALEGAQPKCTVTANGGCAGSVDFGFIGADVGAVRSSCKGKFSVQVKSVDPIKASFLVFERKH